MIEYIKISLRMLLFKSFRREIYKYYIMGFKCNNYICYSRNSPDCILRNTDMCTTLSTLNRYGKLNFGFFN
jgi:hypothetical protein